MLRSRRPPARAGSSHRSIGLLLLALLLGPSLALAQEPGLKLAIGDFGLGFGDVPRLDGLRFNFRDRALERVRGINVTIWEPHEESLGTVTGLGVGVPLTGAHTLRGLGIGAGVAVRGDFDGIGIGALGVGMGGDARGVMVGGLGAGGGGDLSGLALGGLGVGGGGSVRGIAAGGLGVGAGGSVQGIAAGGLGVGAGGDVEGVIVGGLGVGAGGDVTGIAIGGLGVGVGGEATGLVVGGVGAGIAELSGVAIGGLGVGVGSGRGLVIAPGYFELAREGTFRGVSVSAFNHTRGAYRGLQIAILNVADELHGWQVGLLNIARNKDSFSVLPLLNHAP